MPSPPHSIVVVSKTTEELQEELQAREEELTQREEALTPQEEKARISEKALVNVSADLDAK
jgi:hypothetical protein